jgi:hypothetical protein
VDCEITPRPRAHVAAGLAAALLGLLLFAPLAAGLDAPDGTRRWSIWRNGDKVGDYVLAFSHENGLLVVENRIDIVRRLLAVPVWRYKHVERESWRDGRLIALEASTNTDGKKTNLSVRATGEGLTVDGAAGDVVLLTAIDPSTLWSVEMTRASQLLDVETGSVLAVHIAEGAEEPVELGAQQDARARHFSVSGDLARELWYGQDGIIVRMQYLDAEGVTIDFRAASQR